MYGNLLLVFFLSGLWHGAGWNFILWGILHGILYVFTRWWEGRTDKQSVSGKGALAFKKIFAVLGTFSYVSLAWVYFRASTVGEANTLIRQVFSKPWALPGAPMADAFNLGEFWYTLKVLGISNWPAANCYLLFILTVLILTVTFRGKNAAQIVKESPLKPSGAAVAAILFVWCVISLSGVSTFLYFNF